MVKGQLRKSVKHAFSKQGICRGEATGKEGKQMRVPAIAVLCDWGITLLYPCPLCVKVPAPKQESGMNLWSHENTWLGIVLDAVNCCFCASPWIKSSCEDLSVLELMDPLFSSFSEQVFIT